MSGICLGGPWHGRRLGPEFNNCQAVKVAELEAPRELSASDTLSPHELVRCTTSYRACYSIVQPHWEPMRIWVHETISSEDFLRIMDGIRRAMPPLIREASATTWVQGWIRGRSRFCQDPEPGGLGDLAVDERIVAAALGIDGLSAEQPPLTVDRLREVRDILTGEALGGEESVRPMQWIDNPTFEMGWGPCDRETDYAATVGDDDTPPIGDTPTIEEMWAKMEALGISRE